MVSLNLNLDDHMYMVHIYIYLYTHTEIHSRNILLPTCLEEKPTFHNWLRATYFTAAAMTASSPAKSPMDPDGDDPEVICVGLMRTGLQSLHRAFSILGDLESQVVSKIVLLRSLGKSEVESRGCSLIQVLDF